MKAIIIGGVAAGMSAAAKMKRIDNSTEIIVYEKGNYLSYGACGLPYFVSNVNDDYKRMIARTKEEFEQAGIACKLRHEVIKVVPKDKAILVKDLESGKLFVDNYDKLLISTGAAPIRPPLDGLILEGVYVLKTLEDGLLLKEKIRDEKIKNVVIAGAGYIGLEVAEAMTELNKNVTVIELAERILMSFDPEISDLAALELQRNRIELRLNEKVEKIRGVGKVEEVVTSKGRYKADLLILALGVKPATEFLINSGINLAGNGALIVDREMRTNIEDIFAAGDCAEVYHCGKEENSYLPLGTNANKCGRIAGENMLGKHLKYVGTLGSAALKVFNYEVGRTGLGEREAQKLALDFASVYIETYDHPLYYPGATPIGLKVVYEKRSKRILGAQAIGEKGVVLRIDIFAVAIHNKMTTDELGLTDLCYAPPYAGVWDAIHIACNAAK